MFWQKLKGLTPHPPHRIFRVGEGRGGEGQGGGIVPTHSLPISCADDPWAMFAMVANKSQIRSDGFGGGVRIWSRGWLSTFNLQGTDSVSLWSEPTAIGLAGQIWKCLLTWKDDAYSFPNCSFSMASATLICSTANCPFGPSAYPHVHTYIQTYKHTYTHSHTNKHTQEHMINIRLVLILIASAEPTLKVL